MAGRKRTIADGDLVRDECPECGSGSLSWESMEFEGDVAYRLCTCDRCGYRWNDVFLLVQQEPYE